MARAALLHLLRSQSSSLRSGDRFAVAGPWAPTLYSRNNANSTIRYSPAQIRFLSHPATINENEDINIGHKKGGEGNHEKNTEIVYYGPISSTIKKVKLLSLSTFFLSSSLGPVVTFMTSQDSNVILKGVVASSVVLFSASTTAALHWFAHPYVHKLRWQPGSDSFEVQMLSWLATYRSRIINFADIKPAVTNRPYVLFEANGKFYYVDEEQCPHKELVAKLTPWKQVK
ncbi:hypothetical protein ACS0TY_019070 [Phlomoides rotata]